MKNQLVNYKKVRRNIFTKIYTCDVELSQMVDGYASHDFLQNPASQTIYQYLLSYVKHVSTDVFRKNKSKIEILDWGCGKGQSTYFLKKYGLAVESCDIEKYASDSFFGQDTPIVDRDRIQVKALKHDYRLPYSDKSFDVVLSMGVLEHVPYDLESLHEINRILKNDGLLFVFFLPQKSSWTQFVSRLLGDSYHDRLYSKRQVSSLMKSSGFSLQDFWYRQILPKNTIKYKHYHQLELFDQFLTEWTPLSYLSTNIEFVAQKIE